MGKNGIIDRLVNCLASSSPGPSVAIGPVVPPFPEGHDPSALQHNAGAEPVGEHPSDHERDQGLQVKLLVESLFFLPSPLWL